MEPTHRVSCRVSVDYGQFYLSAGGDSAAVWDGRGLEEHLGVGPDIVAVGTAKQDGNAEVVVETFETPPPVRDDADHVGEVSVQFTGGRVRVAECVGRDRVVAMPLGAGWWRCRVSMFGLEDSGADREQPYDGDSYLLQLWPAPRTPATVLHWYGPWQPRTTLVNPYGLRVMVGALAWDERLKMTPVGVRRSTVAGELDGHLFRDRDGAYWEYGAWHGTDLIEVPESEISAYDLSFWTRGRSG